VTTLLALSGFGLAASAQAQMFGVETTAQTMGYTGGSGTDSRYLPSATYTSALYDPAAATISSPYYGSALADVGAFAEAQPATLHAKVSAHTESINATSGFYSAPPYAYGYAHSFDHLTVTSDTLAKGAPVTIVFDTDFDFTEWKYTGLCDTYVDMQLQIGSGSAHWRWTSSYLYGKTTSTGGQIRIQTTVGSQLGIDGKLGVQGKVFYYDYSFGFGGDVKGDITARIVVRDITAGVTLQTSSGAVYPFVPAN
jgi:hypothetical protein